MLLTLFTHPLLHGEDELAAFGYAVDEENAVWREFRPGLWGQGCLSVDRKQHVFLRPCWARSFPPLTLDGFRDLLFRREAERRAEIGAASTAPVDEDVLLERSLDLTETGCP